MRRMLTSRQIEILDSMTEEVFESGVWEIDSGTTDGSLNLKNLEVGYQYRIYLNASSPSSTAISRFETELGLSQSYYDFVEDGKNIYFILGTLAGATNARMIFYKSAGVVTNRLSFAGTTTDDLNFRYLITRHKLYI